MYGAGAAGIMLYGISLLAGVLGSCHLPTMAAAAVGADRRKASWAITAWCWPWAD